MTNHTPDYAGVIADLKRRRDEIDQMIKNLESMVGEIAVAAPSEIRSDTFFGMTIVDAAKKFLTMDTRPKAANEIADALERGGMVHESKNFTNTVYTSLRREDQKNGEVIALPNRQWGLTERYPEAARKRAAGIKDATPEQMAGVVPGASLVEDADTAEEREAVEPTPNPFDPPSERAQPSGQSQSDAAS